MRPKCLPLVAFAALTVGCGTTANTNQHDMDRVRIAHVDYLAALTTEFFRKTGRMPLADEVQGKEIEVFITHRPVSPKILERTARLPIVLMSAADLKADLERGLGRTVDLPSDPQNYPTYGPNFYIYGVNAVRACVAGHLFFEAPGAERVVGPNARYYKYERCFSSKVPGAGPIEEAGAASGDGEFAAALELTRPLADGGNAEAQHRLARMYESGQGVPQDHSKAVEWYRKAADQGFAPAQHDLGLMYLAGRGVPRDCAAAAAWFRKAAEQGLAGSQVNYGRLLLRSDCGTRADPAEAAKWIGTAAWQGTPAAQWTLGDMYRDGQGVPQDEAEAVAWYRKAAEQGHMQAQNDLGAMYGFGRGVARDYEEALRWYRRAAAQGDALAEVNIGRAYEEGLGAPQDYAEAMRWYRRAADCGDVLGSFHVGLLYADGLGVPKDAIQAYMWFSLAASRPAPPPVRDVVIANRDAIAKLLSPEQWMDGQRLAREWRPAKCAQAAGQPPPAVTRQ